MERIELQNNLQNLEEYIFEQQSTYLGSVSAYSGKLELVVEKNLDKKDWSFNSASREWTNSQLGLILKPPQGYQSSFGNSGL